MSAFSFSEEQKAQILQTALTTAGPGATSQQIAAEVERVALLMSPGSLIGNAFSRVERKYANVDEWKVFQTTLIHVNKETTSGRAILVFQGAPNEHNQNTGQEIARSGPTEWDMSAKELANSAMRMVGHRVLVSIGIELMVDKNGNKTGRKTRVLHDIQSLGEDTQFFPNGPGSTPNLPPVAWQVLGGAGKAFNTQNLAIAP